MFRLATKKGAFPVLTALAVLAVASSARSAIQTNLASTPSSLSWSAPLTAFSQPIPSEPKAEPTTLPRVEALILHELNAGFVPQDMNGQDSTQNQSSGGVASLAPQNEELFKSVSTPLISRTALIFTTWQADVPLDPPKAP